MHYENFVESSKTVSATQYDINILDLIHYHVMGDYRVVNESGALKYKYSTLQSFNSNTDYIHSSIKLENLLRHPIREDTLYGIYSKDPADFGYTMSEVPWMSKELNSGSSGTRLMLPSIGTQIVATFGYDLVAEELQKSVLNLVEHLNKQVMTGKYQIESATEQSVEGYEDYIVIALLEALEAHPELTSTQKQNIRSANTRALTQASSLSDYRKRLFQEIIRDETSRFIAGSEVLVNDFTHVSQAEEDAMRDAIGDIANIREVLCRVEAVEQGRNSSGQLVYTYDLAGVFDTFTLTNVRESALLPSDTSRERDIKKKKKKWVAPPSAEDAVLYRCIIDHLAAMQAYLYLTSQEVLAVPYLSESLNPRKEARFITSTQFPNLRPPTDGRTHDATPRLYFSKDARKKIKLKPKDSLLYKLIALRNTFAQVALGAQRSSPSVFDKKIFDDFYKDDLRLKEVNWLAYALSEEGKVLVEKPRQIDPMAVLMYRRPGADTGVSATAPLDLRTAFYRIDAPMIKEVYNEYISIFNETTLSMAYMVESASAEPKAGKIAKAIWGQLKRKTTDFFVGGIIPHRFFGTLFSNVNGAIANTQGVKDSYPPSWGGTNLITQLSQNPLELGITVPATLYQQSLDEYIDFLMARYGGSPAVASAVLSAIESYTITTSTDYTQLREQFVERIKDNEKNARLKSTSFVFRAYATVLSIMRAELSVPLRLREDAIAQGLEEDFLAQQGIDRGNLSAQLREAEPGKVGIQACPMGHPLAPQAGNRAQNINVNLGLR